MPVTASSRILYTGALLHGIYDLPAIKHDAWRVYTNTPPCGAQRGHGTVDSRTAFEALMNEMAAELGLDPFAVRRINLLPAIPYTTAYAQRVMSYGLPECLDKVMKASGWAERRGKMPKGRGLGLACSHFVSGTTTPKHWTGEPHATVNLRVDFDGARHCADRRRRHRPGLQHHGGADGGRGAGSGLEPPPGDFRRQRAHPEGQRLLFLTRHLHGRQRRYRGRQRT